MKCDVEKPNDLKHEAKTLLMIVAKNNKKSQDTRTYFCKFSAR